LITKLFCERGKERVNKISIITKMAESYSAGNFPKSGKRTFEGPEKWTVSFDPPNISAGSFPKTQKTEPILAKLQHTNSHKGFNIKYGMTLSPQEMR
jgi:hypothetical protein